MLQLISTRAKQQSEGYSQIAVLDLGSNSFRLQIGRIIENQIYPMDSLKESVRLASGLTAEKRLDSASQQRAIAALSRFGERLRGFRPETVRVVATNTFRVAKNAADFLRLAEEALGFPIEIIGGREEARLIYIGVAHTLPSVDHKRLVIDIGGGSTEFIIGRKNDPILMESLSMGCVSYSTRFFPDGKIDKKRFREAEMAAAQEIAGIASGYKDFGWDETVGSSGTARTIACLLELNQLNPGGVGRMGGITRSGLDKLRTLMIRAGSADKLDLAGLPVDRLPVLPGGVAIMCAIFAQLEIERINYAKGALRLGVFYDLLGRFHQHDMRDATVHQFKLRYQIDQRQASRVEKTALLMYGQLHGQLFGPLFDQRIVTKTPEDESDLRFLKWAAALHEIGISIAHNGFHKHGAYILSAADMPGFSKKDQTLLAQLVLGQRGKLEKVTGLSASDSSWHLLFSLRLATLLHRARDDQPLPELNVSFSQDGYQIELPDYWMTTNPLSVAALSDEMIAWQKIGSIFQMKFSAQQQTVAFG